MSYNTEKKILLLNFFKSNKESAYTVEEILASLSPSGNAKSTVYRLISRLCEEGTLRKLFDEDSRRISYQYMDSGHCREHLHLKCKECGRLIHLDESISHILENKLLESRGFEMDGGAILPGRCQECRGGAL
ncbi:MAG: transcriptional repressor [Clostridia bacterium]|nr:transcriptional repressor [Clostridia bacterium]